MQFHYMELCRCLFPSPSSSNRTPLIQRYSSWWTPLHKEEVSTFTVLSCITRILKYYCTMLVVIIIISATYGTTKYTTSCGYMAYCFPALRMCRLLTSFHSLSVWCNQEPNSSGGVLYLPAVSSTLLPNPHMESPALYLSLYAVMYFLHILSPFLLHCVFCSFREA